jgi:accessory gene regulator B
MFVRTSQKITDNMIKRGVVEVADRETYLFGVQQGLFIALNIATTIAVGLILGTLWQLAVFTVAYMILRSYAGGYHASTPIRCYLISTLIMVVVSFLIRYVTLHTFAYVGLIMLSGIIIFALSPVGDKNKPLDSLEEKVYRKRAVIICAIEVLTAMVMLYFRYDTVVWTLVAVSMMMLIAKVKKGNRCKNA